MKSMWRLNQTETEGDQFEDEWYRCSRCGTWLKYEETREGGRYNFAYDTVTTLTSFNTLSNEYVIVSPNEAANGCLFCGTPESTGYARPDAMVKRSSS